MHVGVCSGYRAVLCHEQYPVGAAEEGAAVPSIARDILAAQQVDCEQRSG
jgi:hypothetical protein